MYIVFLIKIHYSKLTKAAEQVQRLVLILQILKTVSRKLFNLINQVLIFERLDSTFKNLILNDSLIDTDFMIDYEICFNTKKLMDHYLAIKKISSVYDPVSNKVITERNSKKNTNKQIKLFKHISYSLNSGPEMQPVPGTGRSRNFFYFFLNFWSIFATVKSRDTLLCMSNQFC